MPSTVHTNRLLARNWPLGYAKRPAIYPEQQAAIFALTHFEQLDRNEVAAILSISPRIRFNCVVQSASNSREQLNKYQGV